MSRKNETITQRIARVAKRFERTHDLGYVGGWFDRELSDMTPIGIAWFTSQVLHSLSETSRWAFILDLDAM